MNSTPPAPSPEQTTSGVSADHPGVNELFALLAYGEVAAFYRLTEEARMAPNLRGRINMASMAAAEMNHYEMLRDALERRGVDVVPAMTKYASALENYHRLTTPSTWLEALVKTYVGDALAADFYLEIADALPDEVADVVRAVLSETGHSQFVVAEVQAAVTASDKQRHRLALWSRRLLGEAITQAQYVLADHDELVDLVMSQRRGPDPDDRVLRPAAAHAQHPHARAGPGLTYFVQFAIIVLLFCTAIARARRVGDAAVQLTGHARRGDRTERHTGVEHDGLRPRQRDVHVGLQRSLRIGVDHRHQVDEIAVAGHPVGDRVRRRRGREPQPVGAVLGGALAVGVTVVTVSGGSDAAGGGADGVVATGGAEVVAGWL